MALVLEPDICEPGMYEESVKWVDSGRVSGHSFMHLMCIPEGWHVVAIKVPKQNLKNLLIWKTKIDFNINSITINEIIVYNKIHYPGFNESSEINVEMFNDNCELLRIPTDFKAKLSKLPSKNNIYLGHLSLSVLPDEYMFVFTDVWGNGEVLDSLMGFKNFKFAGVHICYKLNKRIEKVLLKYKDTNASVEDYVNSYEKDDNWKKLMLSLSMGDVGFKIDGCDGTEFSGVCCWVHMIK